MAQQRSPSPPRRLPAEVTHARQNELLARLPEPLWKAWEPMAEIVDLPLGTVVYERGDAVHYVYFPTSCVLSIMQVLADGASAQVAVVGREGFLGVAAVMGGPSRSRVVVQCPGQAVRLASALIANEFQRGGAFMQLMLRSIQALVGQMSQMAVCNRHHSPEQQFCRWLLLCLDRLDRDELDVTQEFVAGMLGVRRETVTEAARRLQAQGIIESRRGHIRVVDRAHLERCACECYGVVRAEYLRIFTG